MSVADERRAIEGRFDTQWAAGPYATTPVYYEGVLAPQPARPEEHVVVAIRGVADVQRTLGASTYDIEHTGLVLTSVFVPRNTGTQRAKEVADWIVVNVWRRASFNYGSSGTVTCAIPSVTVVPSLGDAYTQVEITTEYTRAVRVAA